MKRGVDHPHYRHGFRAGYSEWRYGDIRVPPRRQEPIFEKQQHAHMVAVITEVMGDWTSSRFQNEGPCRHGLRQSLCLKGYSWDRSDAEAARIVREALANLRAVRPTFEQGQPEWTIPLEYCFRCGVPLDEEDIARQRRFCSTDCAKATIVHRQFEQGYWADKIGRAAHKHAMKARFAPRPCKECGKDFRPAAEDSPQAYCSRSCSSKAQTTTLERPCAHCGTMFRPSGSNKGECCSVPCALEMRKIAAFEKVCEFCGTGFVAKAKKAKFCGHACASASSRIRSGTWFPKLVSPHVFDHFLIVAPARRPAWLTPETFDEMLAIAA